MKRLLLAIAFVLVASADSGAQGCYGPGCGAGAVTITSGTTATSGCVAGGVLRSISNMVDCGAGLTYDGSVFQMGATITSGSAVNQTFRSHNATTGTDISGGNLTIAAPGGTGSSTGGTIAFQTAPVLASGTTAQTPVDRLTIGKSGTVTIGTLASGANVTALAVNAPNSSSGSPSQWPFYVQVQSGRYFSTWAEGAGTNSGGFSITTGSPAGMNFWWNPQAGGTANIAFNRTVGSAATVTGPQITMNASSLDLQVSDGSALYTGFNMASTGAVTLGGSTITGTTVAATISNGTSSGNTARFEDSATDYLAIDNTSTQSSIIAQGGSLRLGTIDSSTAYLTFDAGGGAATLTTLSTLNVVGGVGSIQFSGSTGDGTWTNTRSSIVQSYAANSTSASNSNFLFRLNPGNTSNGFGNGILFQGQSSTTASQDMVRVSGVWTDATHASRSAAMVFETVNNAGALTERMRIGADGAILIGNSSVAGTTVAATINGGSSTGNVMNWDNDASNSPTASLALTSYDAGWSSTLGATYGSAAGSLNFNYGSGNTILTGFGGTGTLTMNRLTHGANTTTLNQFWTLDMNPGNTSAGWGNGLTITGRSSSTAAQHMGFFGAQWTTATHASRTSKVVVQNVNNAGSLTTTWEAQNGHAQTVGTAPAVSSCGTTPSAVTGSDGNGRFTVGSTGTVTSCTLTFAIAYNVAPACVANNETALELVRAVATTTTLTIDGTDITTDTITYICRGN